MNDLIIVGSGGLGRETAWTTERINESEKKWNILGFIDDAPEKKDKIIDGYTILGSCDTALKYPDAYFVCAVGKAYVRKMIVNKLKRINPDIKFATIIDPAAVICTQRTHIGNGSIICANTYITVDITIGEHTYIGGNCTVGHDAKFSDFVTLYPSSSVSGNVSLGECCELGTGARIIQGISVANNTIIGAGAAVVRDLPPDCTAVGVPAKPIKMNSVKI